MTNLQTLHKCEEHLSIALGLLFKARVTLSIPMQRDLMKAKLKIEAVRRKVEAEQTREARRILIK